MTNSADIKEALRSASPTQARHRETWVNFIFLFCAAGFVLVNVAGNYVEENRFLFLLSQFGRFAAPVLFIVFGALMRSSMTKDEKSEGKILRFYMHWAWRILLPYVLWTAAYTAFACATSITRIDFPWGWIYNFGQYLATGYAQLYILLPLLQLALLFPLLNLLFKRGWGDITLIISFWVSAYLQAALYLRAFNIILLPTDLFGFVPLTFPAWLFYFVFGAWFIDRLSTWRRRVTGNTELACLLFLAGAALCYFDAGFNNLGASSLRPTIMVFSVTAFIFFFAVHVNLSKPKDPTRSLLARFAPGSYCVFLCSGLVYMFVEYLLYITKSTFFSATLYGNLILMVAVFALSFILARALSFLPRGFGLAFGADRLDSVLPDPPQ